MSKDYNKELLSHEKTMELIKEAQKGSKDARNELVVHNIGLVRSVLKGFANRGYETDDLFQIGSIGLIKAIDKFDLSFNVKFSTYAVPMIIGEIRRFLRDDGLIKVSRSLKQIAGQAKKISEDLFKELGREPSIKEIAKELDMDYEEVVMAIESSYYPEYLHNVIHENEGSPLHLIDKIGSDTDDDDIVDRILIKDILNQLEARDRQIIILRYFKDKTQTEVAEELGISQVQVSRIEKKIIEELRLLMVKA